MKNIDKDSKQAIFITGIFCVIPMLLAVVMLNLETYNFIESLKTILVCLGVIIFVEFLSQEANWKNSKRRGMVGELVLKGFAICLSLTVIFFLVIITALIYTLNDDSLTKTIFNSIISFSFFSTLISYCLYVKLKFPELVEKGLIKLKKGEESLNPVSKNRIYRKKVIKIFDFISIWATVFLLGNSTFTTLDTSSLKLDSNPLNTIEFLALFFLMPIFVQSAYYRIVEK